MLRQPREGVPLVVIQRQLGHADLGIASAYLRGIDNTEIIDAVHNDPRPMVPPSARLAIHDWPDGWRNPPAGGRGNCCGRVGLGQPHPLGRRSGRREARRLEG